MHLGTTNLKALLASTFTVGALWGGAISAPVAVADPGVGPAGLDAEADYLVAMKNAGMKYSKREIITVVKLGYLFCDLKRAYAAADRLDVMNDVLNRDPMGPRFFNIAIANLCPGKMSPPKSRDKQQQALDALGPTTQRTLGKINDTMGKIADEPLIDDKDTDFVPDPVDPDHGKSYSPGS